MYRGTATEWEVTMANPELVATHARFDEIEAEFHAALDATLDPRGPDALFELVAGMALPAGSSVVDVGCGRGRQAVELSRRFGFRVLGIDPHRRTDDAEEEATTLGSGMLRFEKGTAESIPLDDATVDLVFCRESLMYADLAAAVSDFHRVLRSGGRGLVYLVLNGPRIIDTEASELWAPLAPNMRPGAAGQPAVLHGTDIAQALRRGGFTIDEQVDYRSEWGELAQEHNGTAGRRLLHAARLLRQPDRYIEEFGQANYDIMLGDCLWHIYRMIGKLTGYAVTFTKA